jgi:hypothetical protein
MINSSTPFKLTVNKTFLEVIKASQKATDYLKPDVKGHYVYVNNGKTFFIGYSDDIRAVLNIDSSAVKGKGIVQVDPKLLLDILKKRDTTEITHKDGKLWLKSGRFEAELPTEEMSAYAVETVREIFGEREGQKVTLSDKITESIKTGIQLTRIKSLYTDDPINCYVTYDGTQLMLGGNDDFHMAVFRQKLKTMDKPFQTVFPIGIFDVISSVFGTESVDFVFSAKDILVRTSVGRLIIPPVQEEEGGFDIIPNFLNTLQGPSLEFDFTRKFIDSILSVSPFNHSDDPLDFEVVGSNTVKLSIDSQTGKASEVLEVDDLRGNPKLSFDLNPRIMTDLFHTVTKHMKAPAPYKNSIVLTMGLLKGKAVRIDYLYENDMKAKVTLVGSLA